MLKIAGLNTSTHDFVAPEGALQIANNININVPNLAEPRKGFERLATGWDNATERTELLTYYKDKLIAIHTRDGESYSQIEQFDSGTWSNLKSSIYPNDSGIWRSAQANGNLFVTSARGVQTISGLTAIGDNQTSGIPAGIGIDPSVTGGSGFLANGDTVAYRAVFLRKDANENLVFGAPTNRGLLTNSGGGNRNATIRVDIPVDIRIGDLVRLYRSVAVSTGSPNDELQQVAEFELTSTEVNQSYVDITDSVDESLLGATIYTAASQEGLENANYRPPACEDLAEFRDCIFYANTRTRDSIKITLTDAALMANDDTITFSIPSLPDTRIFTAKNAEAIGSQEFKLFTSGTSVENTRNTAKSLCRIINHRSLNLGYSAFYLENESAGTGLGEILITRQSLEANQFYTTVSNTTPFLPATLETSGTNTPSSSDTFANGLYWSKPFEPEAVPLPNQTRVASKDKEIQRIVALDEALIIFKEDGVYRLTGYYPSFEIELMDASIKLVTPDSVAVLSNEIYCLTTQGVAVISSQSVKIISTPIEDELFSIFDTHLSNVETYAFGVAREVKRSYYLFYPEGESDTKNTAALVYNIYTKTWVKHIIEADCGLEVDNDFYLGDSNSEFILQERSTGTNRDYADYGFTDTITAISDLTITLNSNVDNVSVGDILYQSTTVYSPITAVDVFNSQVTVAADPGFTAASVDVLTSIPTEIKWLPNALGRPEINKQVHTATPLFKAGFVGDATLDFSTDISPGTESVTLAGTSLLGWGLTGWGSTPWGDTPDRRPFRQWLPRSKQRANWYTIGIRHSYGFSGWKLQGIRLLGDFGDEKTGK